ncbi:hypothetical protein C8Q79DRAFT_135054 [Trametes meyenii]|nr:hypothetical protein C8Q79DRAFT_135054 [Trametes meyenii]
MTRSTRRLLAHSGLYKRAYSHKQSRTAFGIEGIPAQPASQTGASATFTPVPLVASAVNAQPPTTLIVGRFQDTRPPLRARSFPDEVVRIILSCAWLSLHPCDPMVRWALFRAVGGVNHQWRDGIVEVATRYVEVCLRSNADLAGYLTVGRTALLKHSSHPHESLNPSVGGASQPELETDTTSSSRSRPIPTETDLSKVFKRTTIGLYVPRDEELPTFSLKRVLSEHDVLQLGYSGQDLHTEWSSGDTEYLTLLRQVVPNCSKVIIDTAPCTGLRSTLTQTILEFVASLQSPTRLDFDTFLEPSETRDRPRDEAIFPWERRASPFLPLPKIRTLRFKEYPTCSCAKRELGSGHAESFCFAFQLMRAFPGVERLHIDAPILLKYIIPPPNLHILVLQVPPRSEVRGAAPSNHSIIEYNLGEAVDRGLFKVQPLSRRRVVVFNTCEPQTVMIGWSNAAAACERWGVTLLRRHSQLRNTGCSVERTIYLDSHK